MRIVISFGHAALDAGRDVLAHSERFRGVQVAARGLHALLDAGHTLVATHAHERPAPDLRHTGQPDPRALAAQEARADGLAGYLLEQALRNLCTDKRSFATLVTHTLVDDHDPAFAEPARMLGPQVEEAEARRLERTLHWTMRPEEEGWRRAVAAPEPLSVLQSRAIATLLNGGHTVLCSGGGIAVMRDVQRHEHGVEALVDPDLGAARLAIEIGADALLVATDVPCVYAGWPSSERQPLRQLSAVDPGLERFAPGSMRPKVDAAARFARHGGIAVIGSLGDLPELLDGRAGTRLEA